MKPINSLPSIALTMLLIGCGGSAASRPASPAGPQQPVQVRGWTVQPVFGEASLDSFNDGSVVIVPLKAVRRAGSTGDHRSAFHYVVDAPDPDESPLNRYAWGREPIDNGHGTYHWYHERLAFDRKARVVTVLPRRGMKNVDLKQAGGRQFWCDRNALDQETISMDRYSGGGGKGANLSVCPTALIRSEHERKGVPVFGTPKELYAIDTAFVGGLVAELALDEEAERIAQAEERNREAALAKRIQERKELAVVLERERTAGARAQEAIARLELGAKLCADVDLGGHAAVITAFLEDAGADKVKVRVNSIRSRDGSTRWEGRVSVEGTDFAPNELVWSERGNWRACD